MKRGRRVLSFLLMVVMLLGLLPGAAFAATTASGSCGTNVQWSLSDDGTLTISGTGAMRDYTGNSPWWRYTDTGTIKKIVISSGVTTIGMRAFVDCIAVTSVELPDSLTTIGEVAFYGCESLKNIELPDSLTTIGGNAFLFCKSLESIELPKGLTTMEGSPFRSCASLQNIFVAQENVAFSDVDGVLFNKEKTTLLAYPEGRAGAYTVPNGVSTIGNYAFADCAGVTSIKLPATVTTIGDYAFYCCTGVTNVKLPATVTIIGDCAFEGCGNLTDIELSQNLTSIGGGAFRGIGATYLKIPASVGYIGDGAFAYNLCLGRVDILGDGVQINAGAFATCVELKEVRFVGDAPDMVEVADAFSPFARSPVTLYYIPGTSGWTDSSDYDAAAGTWKGYAVAVWDFYAPTIEQLTDEGIVVNERGRGWGLFRVTDFGGTPLSGIKVNYTLNGTSGHVTSDGNGVFRVELPEVNQSGSYTVKFDMEDFGHKPYGAEQTVYVTAQLAYAQKWSGSLGSEAKLGAGAGAGVSAGVVEAEANAAKASLKGGMNGQYCVEDSYEGDQRTLELTYTYANSAGVEFKSGVEATVATSKIKPISMSNGLTAVNQTSVGLKLENYDPTNLSDLMAAGAFNLQVALTGYNSLWANRILDMLDTGIHNQSAYTQKLIAEAGVDLGAVSSGTSGEDAWLVGGVDAQLMVSASQSEDRLNNTSRISQELATEFGYSLFKDLLPYGGSGWDDSGCNSVKLTANYDENKQLDTIMFTLAEEGKKDYSWLSSVEETTKNYIMSADKATQLINQNPDLRIFLSREFLMFNPLGLLGAAAYVRSGGCDGTTEYQQTVKEGVDFNIPIGAQLGVEAKVGLKGSFAHEISYTDGKGILVDGDEYVISHSGITSDEIESKAKTLGEILNEPIKTIAERVKGFFSSVGESLVEGVENGWAAIKETGEEIWVSITEIRPTELASYAVMTLAAENTPDTNAAVAVTIGEPYRIAAYTDESMSTLLSDAMLEEKPLTLTLSYNQAMLTAAGVTGEADIHIFYFDEERNAYIPVQNGVQDKSAMTVTAEISRQGEYILATDNASPLISDFAVSDGTALPTLTALVSDLSGIGEFTLWVDEQSNVLVDSATFEEYYDAESGWLTYTFETPLSAGKHTVYAQACDQLGNANAQPFTFVFQVDAVAPIIGSVTVPMETVTDPNGFRVTAQASDDAMLAQVILNAVDDRGGKRTVSMVQADDGSWYADVTDVAGLGSMAVSVLAVDAAGNRTESIPQMVSLAVPEEPTGVKLAVEKRTQGICITVSNYDSQAISGWLVCAVYDEYGKMYDLDSVYLGLQGEESKEYDLPLTANDRDTVKAFLLDGTGDMIPLTDAPDADEITE